METAPEAITEENYGQVVFDTLDLFLKEYKETKDKENMPPFVSSFSGSL
jgi:hypothetical protein